MIQLPPASFLTTLVLSLWKRPHFLRWPWCLFASSRLNILDKLCHLSVVSFQNFFSSKIRFRGWISLWTRQLMDFCLDFIRLLHHHHLLLPPLLSPSPCPHYPAPLPPPVSLCLHLRPFLRPLPLLRSMIHSILEGRLHFILQCRVLWNMSQMLGSTFCLSWSRIFYAVSRSPALSSRKFGLHSLFVPLAPCLTTFSFSPTPADCSCLFWLHFAVSPFFSRQPWDSPCTSFCSTYLPKRRKEWSCRFCCDLIFFLVLCLGISFFDQQYSSCVHSVGILAALGIKSTIRSSWSRFVACGVCCSSVTFCFACPPALFVVYPEPVRTFLKSIPLYDLAVAAYRCRAFIRAFKYLETHMTEKLENHPRSIFMSPPSVPSHPLSHASSLSSATIPPAAAAAPAAGVPSASVPASPSSSSSASAASPELQFLQKIYSSIDEPDGMLGIASLRKVTSLMELTRDNESTGNWTQALSCYENVWLFFISSIEMSLFIVSRCFISVGLVLVDRFRAWSSWFSHRTN